MVSVARSIAGSTTMASLGEPYRGSGIDRPGGVPLPPDPMPLSRAGTLLKRWHYVTFWSPELLFCAARVHGGPMAQECWGVWDRQQRLFRQRAHVLVRRVALGPDKVEGAQIAFRQEANIRKRGGLFLFKSRYDHAFGSYEGTLPGGIELREAVGVRERQDAIW